MKVFKKAALALLGAALGCCMFAGCISTKLSVTYMVDGETYRVQEYDMDTKIALPTAPTKEGHTFIGWYTDEACTVPYAEGSVTTGLTLYAKFSVSSVYIVVNANGGTKIDAIEVTPGGDYTVPAAEKEGHTFIGYTYVDENGEVQDFPLTGKYPSNTGIRITANYEVNKYAVVFVGVEESEQEVAHGSVAVAPAMDKAGYDFLGWYTSETEQTDETKFDFATVITGDVTLYAKYSPKTFTITVNGAQIDYVNPQVVYGETYTLAIPDRGANYEFVKFTMNGEDFPATGSYTWTEDIAVDAVWDGVGRDIMFFDGNVELANLRIESEYEADISSLRLPSVPSKVGYTTDGKWYVDAACTEEFVAEGTITEDIHLYAKYTANKYTITFVVWDAASKTMKNVPVIVTYGQAIANVPERADRDSYDFMGYVYNGEAFDTSAVYAYTEDITVEEKWELNANASNFEYDAGGNFFKERPDYDSDWTYVYLIGETYEFASTVQLSMVTIGGEAYATVSGNTLTAKAAGTFVVKVDNNGKVSNRTIKTVEYVQSFSLGGTAYDAAWGLNAEGTDYKRNATDVWEKKASIDAGEAMKVGQANFIPEINVNGKVMSMDMYNINISVEVDGVATDDYVIDNGVVNFGSSLVGKKVVLTATPKYAVNANHKAVYNLEVNTGINVYTNEEMKAAFANANIPEINVLRNINVVLSDDQLIKFNVNGWEMTSPKNNGNNVDGKDKATGAYTRRSGSLKVNGNYFTVESSKVPLVDARSGETSVLNKPDGSEYGIVDTRFSLFLLGTRATASADVYQIDNLNIKGNGDMDAAKSYQCDGREVLQNSGAAICVEVGSGTLNMNNVTSRFGSFAVLLSSNVPQTINGVETHAITFNAVDCKFEKNWANNIYANGSINVTLDSCYIGSANGAAVHYDVSPSSIAVDAELNMINDTVIDNWVTGEEAWFIAQGASGAVGAIKAQVEPNIQSFSQGTKSIVKIIDGVEKVNFAVLMRRKGENGEWLGGKDGLGSNWLANTDATYRGYIQQNYIGQGALAFNQPALDLAYLTFMNGAGYPSSAIQSYVGNALMNNKYVYFPSELLGYMEFLVEMVNA